MYVDTLNLKGQKYKVYFKKLPDHILGLCEKDNKKIFINTSCPRDKIVATTAHEITHGLINELYLDQSLDHSQEEVICEMIAYIVDNFLEYFLELREASIEG